MNPVPRANPRPKDRASERERSAFTIIEVLVATFIFAIVLASLFGTWRVISRSTEGALRLASESQRTRLALQLIESSLSAAEMFQANSRWYAFLADTSGSYAELSFGASLSDSFPGSGFFAGQQLRRVTFRVEPSPEGGNDLVLDQKALLAPEDGAVAVQSLVLAHDVSLFQLEFWDKRRSEFVNEWLTTNQLPMAVRVTLGFGAADRTARQSATIISRTVRLPDNAVTADLQGGAAGPQPTPR